ncbi:MAG: hypothetical protein AAF571_03405 [Verrucomicrobiota bacterium]
MSKNTITETGAEKNGSKPFCDAPCSALPWQDGPAITGNLKLEGVAAYELILCAVETSLDGLDVFVAQLPEFGRGLYDAMNEDAGWELEDVSWWAKLNMPNSEVNHER